MFLKKRNSAVFIIHSVFFLLCELSGDIEFLRFGFWIIKNYESPSGY